MKVKISKTIDINEIPGEVRRMLDKAKNDLVYGLPDQMSQVVRSSLSPNGQEFFATIEMIDGFRRNLAVFDENLQEIYNVLSSYKKAVMPPPPAEELPKEEYSEEWLEKEEAEYEKRMTQEADADEDDEDEEG